jgi:hypothetical protein
MLRGMQWLMNQIVHVFKLPGYHDAIWYIVGICIRLTVSLLRESERSIQACSINDWMCTKYAIMTLCCTRQVDGKINGRWLHIMCPFCACVWALLIKTCVHWPSDVVNNWLRFNTFMHTLQLSLFLRDSPDFWLKIYCRPTFFCFVPLFLHRFCAL